MKLWVDYDLKSAVNKAEQLEEARVESYTKDFADLDSANLERVVTFVADVARSEQERETNLNTRGATVATVAGLIVSVSGAVAKSVFGLSEWEDWTKIAAVALFLLALFAVATSMVASVFFVLRPRRGARTKSFLGETLANLWLDESAHELVGADRYALDALFVERSMRTLPGWHFRNRGKARWLRRSWMLLTVGMVFIAIAAVFVLARILEVTPPDADGPAADLTWGSLGVMIGIAAVLAWAAIRFDWLRAGRGNKLEYKVPSDISDIAARLSQSPLSKSRGDENKADSPVPTEVHHHVVAQRKQPREPT